MSITQDRLDHDLSCLVKAAREIVAENDELRALSRKLGDQLDDAMDEVYALKVTIRERDEIIAELQSMSASRRVAR